MTATDTVLMALAALPCPSNLSVGAVGPEGPSAPADIDLDTTITRARLVDYQRPALPPIEWTFPACFPDTVIKKIEAKFNRVYTNGNPYVWSTQPKIKAVDYSVRDGVLDVRVKI